MTTSVERRGTWNPIDRFRGITSINDTLTQVSETYLLESKFGPTSDPLTVTITDEDKKAKVVFKNGKDIITKTVHAGQSETYTKDTIPSINPPLTVTHTRD